jgi:hypothetical protein
LPLIDGQGILFFWPGLHSTDLLVLSDHPKKVGFDMVKKIDKYSCLFVVGDRKNSQTINALSLNQLAVHDM